MSRPVDRPFGAPCWCDLMTTDLTGARSFYSALLGWASEDPDPAYGGYVNFTLDGRMVAGANPNPEPDRVPDTWNVYLSSPDASATVTAAERGGGAVFLRANPVGPLGTMAVIGDPGGAPIGVWQPGEHRGFGVLDVPGAPAWFQCVTRDYDAVVAFYRDVFGWAVRVESDTPEFRYAAQVADDGTPLAGVHDVTTFLPPEVPSHWEVVFQCDDTDAVLDEVVRLGGTVRSPAADSPYGRLGVAADPTGAAFGLISNRPDGT